MKHVQSLMEKLRGLDFISVLSGSSQICQRVFWCRDIVHGFSGAHETVKNDTKLCCAKWIARVVESKPAYCHKCYADLKHSQNWFGVLNLLTLLLNLLKTAEILPWRRYESVISYKEPTKAERKGLLRLKGSGKVCLAQHKLTFISPSKTWLRRCCAKGCCLLFGWRLFAASEGGRILDL